MSEQNVQVTQADREAAENLLWDMHPEASWNGSGEEVENRRLLERVAIGEEDDHPFVQAFARHRTRAEPDLELLKDPNAVHINMLRGGIARLSVRQIIHIYGEEALKAEMSSREPDLVEQCARIAERHAAPEGVPQLDYDRACRDIAASIRAALTRADV